WIEGTVLEVVFSTLADNVSGRAGGGIAAFGPATVTLDSSILDGNTATFGSDLSGTAKLTNSLISRTDGAIITGSTNLVAVSAHLLPLADNGGPTQTRLPAPGSPVRDAGAEAAYYTTDQRGPGYPRIVGGRADLGAIDSADSYPIATVIFDASPTP